MGSDSILCTMPLALADALGLREGSTIHVPKAVEGAPAALVELEAVSHDDETIHYRVRRFETLTDQLARIVRDAG